MFQKSFFSKADRRAQIAVGAFLVATLTAVAAPTFEKPAEAARTRASKFEVCHRTNAIKNPYRLISVAWSSVNPDGNGHDNPVHDGPVFNVANPVGSHGTTPRDSGLGNEAGGGNDRWGDIFNAVKGPGNGNSNANNWTTAGQAIFNGATFTINGVTKAACRRMSAVDYIKSEREENPNRPMSDIMDELDEMQAADDAALKQSLTGGSFSAWFASCNQATTNCEDTTVLTESLAAESPRVTTEPPSSISNGVSNNNETATLNGTISPQGVSMVWYFELDDDPNLDPDANDSSDVQEVPGTPGTSNSATTQNVTFNATGLDSNKTYYYRTVGVASSGSADTLVETYLYGVVKQFSYGAPASPTINSTNCGNGSLSVAFTAGSANGGTITNYQISVDGGATFTARNPVATTSPIVISGLTNGTEYQVVIRAVTSTKTGTDSAVSLGTPCGTPGATTTAATSVQPTTATLNGHLTGNGNALASISFTWSTVANLSSGTTVTQANTTTLPGTASAYPVLANLTGLTGGTTYYFQVSGTYSGGSQTVSGGILSFVTPAAVVPPVATTDPASNIASTTATLNGTGTSNGLSSTVSCIFGTVANLSSGTTTVTASQSPIAASASNAPVTCNVSSLTPGTTYYFRIRVSNANGVSDGIIRQFTTPAAPTTTTVAAPTTTVPVANNSVGGVAGTVWIDTDADDTKDAAEVWIPGVVVTLSGTGSGTATTNSSGAFSFTNLAPGSYAVSAALPAGVGLTISWDSQGTADWKVTVTVVAGQTAQANYAARGDITATGRSQSLRPGTDVNIDWSGVDKELDTTDDVTFTAKVDDQNTFTVRALPTGRYRVRAQALREVITIGTAGATFSNSRLSMTARPAASIAATLPETGSSSPLMMLPAALAMIPLGLVAMGASRRRRRA